MNGLWDEDAPPGPVTMLANQTHFGTGNLSSVPNYQPEDWGTSKMGVRIRAEQYSRSKWRSLHKGTPVLRTNYASWDI